MTKKDNGENHRKRTVNHIDSYDCRVGEGRSYKVSYREAPLV